MSALEVCFWLAMVASPYVALWLRRRFCIAVLEHALLQTRIDFAEAERRGEPVDRQARIAGVLDLLSTDLWRARNAPLTRWTP